VRIAYIVLRILSAIRITHDALLFSI